MLNKTKLVYDPDKGGDETASYLKGSDGELITNTPIGDKKALDVNIANGSVNIFTKPFDRIEVISKTEEGDPAEVKSMLLGVNVQLVTIAYDADGDFLNLQLSDY